MDENICRNNRLRAIPAIVLRSGLALLMVVPVFLGHSTAAASSPDSRSWETVAICATPPGEVLGLEIASDAQTLTWIVPLDDGGEAPLYDTLRSGTPWDFGTGSMCIESSDGADLQALLPGFPTPGTAFYYLVRAENTCGPGTLGAGVGAVTRPAGRDCESSPPIDYLDSIHTAADCASAGGSLVAIGGNPDGTEVCRFNQSFCPGGWSPAGDWSTTSQTGTPWSMTYATFATICNGVTFDWPPIAASGTLASGSHSWFNQSPESEFCFLWRIPPATQTFGDCADARIDQVSSSSTAPGSLCGGVTTVSQIEFSEGGGVARSRWERGTTLVFATAITTQRGCY
jgi:hypothetical protein